MRSIPKLPRRKNIGFTLIELIMTIVVIGIAAVPLSVTLSKHIQSVFDSQDLTMAVNLARFDLEEIHNIDYAAIVSANISNYQGYPYDLTRIISFVNGSSGSNESTKKIIVRITKAGSAVALAELTTYISRNVRYPY